MTCNRKTPVNWELPPCYGKISLPVKYDTSPSHHPAVEIRSPGMGAEDMAYLLQRTRGSFCILGSGKKDGNNEYPHHHPRFDIDEDVLWIGPALFVQLSLDLYDEMIR
jgi:metal-dependent amidase/aminoacylase/carboxypeptidase family protein